MNGPELIVAIVFMALVYQIIRHRLGIQPRSRDEFEAEPRRDYESERLKGQVQQLQERIRVLERIVTDRGLETAAQIEALRESDAIKQKDQA